MIEKAQDFVKAKYPEATLRSSYTNFFAFNIDGGKVVVCAWDIIDRCFKFESKLSKNIKNRLDIH